MSELKKTELTYDDVVSLCALVTLAIKRLEVCSICDCSEEIAYNKALYDKLRLLLREL